MTNEITKANETIEAYAIRGQGGMWLTELPATFGHVPLYMPLLFGDVLKAETVLRELPEYPRALSSIVVVEWKAIRTLMFFDSEATCFTQQLATGTTRRCISPFDGRRRLSRQRLPSPET